MRNQPPLAGNNLAAWASASGSQRQAIRVSERLGPGAPGTGAGFWRYPLQETGGRRLQETAHEEIQWKSVLNRSEYTAGNHLAFDTLKPYLDLIEPRRVSWCKV